GVPKLTQPAPPHPELDWLPKFYPGNPVLRQNRAAGKALNSLARYADSGSKNSACLLVQLATDLVRWMSFGNSRGSDLIRSLAPEFATWPVLVSGHPAAIRDLKKELNRLRVGYVSGFRSDAGARWGMKWDKLHGVTVAI